MRVALVVFIALGLFVCSQSAGARDGDQKRDALPVLSAELLREGYRLRLERASDAHGDAMFALEIGARRARECLGQGVDIVNYLFVDRETGKRRWLFKNNQPCIWRTIYFADRPRTNAIKPVDVRAVVYDVTPSGDLNTWGELRFCTGTNPCLPLRRIFVSRPDGRDLLPLTPSFQVLDPIDGPADIAQRKDGAIVVSCPCDADVVFSIDSFKRRLPH